MTKLKNFSNQIYLVHHFETIIVHFIVFRFLQEADCEKSRMDTKYAADTKIANSRRQYEMQKANFDMEVNARVSSC